MLNSMEQKVCVHKNGVRRHYRVGRYNRKISDKLTSFGHGHPGNKTVRPEQDDVLGASLKSFRGAKCPDVGRRTTANAGDFR